MHEDELCAKVFEEFAKIYGSEAGNLALTTLCCGGLYLVGVKLIKILNYIYKKYLCLYKIGSYLKIIKLIIKYSIFFGSIFKQREISLSY
jgi:hypothetical protein